MTDGFQVTESISGAKATMPSYPLMRGDLLVREGDGSYFKECPGLAVGGFVLTPEQEATLQPVQFINRGLEYEIVEP